MQTQTSLSCKLVIAAAAEDTSPGDVVAAGDTLGIAVADAETGDRLVLVVDGEHGLPGVVPGEAWVEGQRIYYNETTGLFTAEATHWPVGRAGEVKAAQTAGNGFGVIQLDAPHRETGEVLFAVRFGAAFVPAAGAVGDYTLRDFGGSVVLESCEVISDSLAGATAAVSLGDGTGSNDQVLESTAIAGIAGYNSVDDINAAPLLPVEGITKLVLSITGEPITAGFLLIKARFARAA